jgi:hypothetical protein
MWVRSRVSEQLRSEATRHASSADSPPGSGHLRLGHRLQCGPAAAAGARGPSCSGHPEPRCPPTVPVHTSVAAGPAPRTRALQGRSPRRVHPRRRPGDGCQGGPLERSRRRRPRRSDGRERRLQHRRRLEGTWSPRTNPDRGPRTGDRSIGRRHGTSVEIPGAAGRTKPPAAERNAASSKCTRGMVRPFARRISASAIFSSSAVRLGS